MNPRSPSLHRQLVNWLVIPVLVLWILGGIVAYAIAVRYAEIANDRSLFDSALTLAGQVKVEGDQITVDLPRAAKKMLEIDPYDKVHYQVVWKSHDFLTGSPDIPPPPVMPVATDTPYYHDGRIDGEKVRIASIFLAVPGKSGSDQVLVQVAETLVKRRLLASEILAGVVMPQLLLITAAGALLWFGIRRGLSSLSLLQQEVKSRSHLDLSPLSELNAPQEVGSLIVAINDLMARLGATIATQKRFIADAAHQLRTPLAGLKTQTDFALRQSDPEQVQHSLRQLQVSSEQIIHLVNQLLSLARAEPGWERSIPMSELDLNELAGRVTGDWVPEALKKDIDLGFEAAAGEAALRGSELLLREMLGNLIDNALRYTQHGGKVTVRVTRGARSLDLTVEDNGPGIAPQEREHVFDRFHRVLGSQVDGCGLGLAIVREIAHAHGGEVSLLDQPSGAAFAVSFPLPEPGV